MAWIVPSIDSMSRKLKRSVNFISFSKWKDEITKAETPLQDQDDETSIPPVVKTITDWLNRNGIYWEWVTTFTPSVAYIENGPAVIYCDLEPTMKHAKTLELMKMIAKLRNSGVKPKPKLELLRYRDAMINAEQDSERFWDRLV